MRSIKYMVLASLAMLLIQCAKVQEPVEMQIKADNIFTI